jgi:hypothetical protein
VWKRQSVFQWRETLEATAGNSQNRKFSSWRSDFGGGDYDSISALVEWMRVPRFMRHGHYRDKTREERDELMEYRFVPLVHLSVAVGCNFQPLHPFTVSQIDQRVAPRFDEKGRSAPLLQIHGTYPFGAALVALVEDLRLERC